MTAPPDLRHFTRADGLKLAMRVRGGGSPTLFFLPGYASDMDGGKATAIDAFAAAHGLACLRFDYSGTGLSDGDFADGTLEGWRNEALAVMDAHSSGPVIVIGSSMGGWLALQLALARPERVAAVMGIAAAPDFTEWGFDAAQRATILRDGRLEEDNPYGPEPFTTHRGFWESGQRLLMLDKPIAFDGPVRLIHGIDDADVPVGIGHRTVAALTSSDVQLKLIKHGGHRLSEPHEIAAILSELAALIETISP